MEMIDNDLPCFGFDVCASSSDPLICLGDDEPKECVGRWCGLLICGGTLGPWEDCLEIGGFEAFCMGVTLRWRSVIGPPL
jgi:hypothetical protein